jgi:hypothetical protein
MTLSDVSLIGKKIGVGIVVTVVPFVIIVAGLWFTQHALSTHGAKKDSVQTTSKPENHEDRKSN